MGKRRKQGIRKASREEEGKITPIGHLPPGFSERLQEIQAPEHLEQSLASMNADKHVTFRIQRLLADPHSVVQRILGAGVPLEPVGHLGATFVTPPHGRDALLAGTWIADGSVFVQGLSSILAVQMLDPQPGEEVLDLAAAPGGKCTLIADLMKNQGNLAAVEAIRPRMFKLQRLLKQYGVTIARTYLKDGRTVGRKTENRFDRVLLDAPCSGESRFHASRPAAAQFWSPRKIREQAKKQDGLIRSAFTALKPKGKLLYCTCSFAPEENEAIVDSLLRWAGEKADVLDLPWPSACGEDHRFVPTRAPGLTRWGNKSFDPQLMKTARIIPSAYFDGFYLALLTKVGAD
jgi:16S rRNA C967 or C1407 C5-methylase (RsmB/RsmF family)